MQRAFLAVLAAVVLLVAPAAAAAAPSVDGIGARAVDADGKPIDSAYFVAVRNAGSKFVGHVAVTNSGKQFARLYVDPVDAVTSTRGGTVFAARDAPKKEVGNWITPSKRLLRLDPGDEKIVSFEVRVPEDARPGDHVGGITIQPLRTDTTGGQFTIKQVLRVAIATQIRVRGATKEQLDPKVLRLEAVRGSEIPALYVTLANNGDLLCRPTLTATLRRDGGAVSTERREVDTILARTSIDYPLYWPRGLQEGEYEAQVRTTGCGAPGESTATVALSDDLSGTTPPATTGVVPTPEDDAGGFPTWVAVAGGVLLALVLLGLGWWLARRSARRERERLLRELRRRDAERAPEAAPPRGERPPEA